MPFPTLRNSWPTPKEPASLARPADLLTSTPPRWGPRGQGRGHRPLQSPWYEVWGHSGQGRFGQPPALLGPRLLASASHVRSHAPHIHTGSRPPWRNPSGNGNSFPPFACPPHPLRSPSVTLAFCGKREKGWERENKKQGEKTLPALTREKTEIKISKNKTKTKTRTITEGRPPQWRGHRSIALGAGPEAGRGPWLLTAGTERDPFLPLAHAPAVCLGKAHADAIVLFLLLSLNP